MTVEEVYVLKEMRDQHHERFFDIRRDKSVNVVVPGIFRKYQGNVSPYLNMKSIVSTDCLMTQNFTNKKIKGRGFERILLTRCEASCSSLFSPDYVMDVAIMQAERDRSNS